MPGTILKTPITCLAALAALAALCLSACGDADSSYLVARFELPPPEAAGKGPVKNSAGLFMLGYQGAYVSLAVAAVDMDEEVKDTWPDQAGDYAPGVSFVDLELAVPAGDNRQVHAVAFLFADGRPYAFLQGAPHSVDLQEGQTREVTIELVESEVGKVSGAAPSTVVQVWLVDVGELVLLAHAMPAEGTYEFPFAPLNRELAVAWLDTAGKYHSDFAPTFVLVPDVPEHKLDIQP